MSGFTRDMNPSLLGLSGVCDLDPGKTFIAIETMLHGAVAFIV